MIEVMVAFLGLAGLECSEFVLGHFAHDNVEQLPELRTPEGIDSFVMVLWNQAYWAFAIQE